MVTMADCTLAHKGAHLEVTHSHVCTCFIGRGRSCGQAHLWGMGRGCCRPICLHREVERVCEQPKDSSLGFWGAPVQGQALDRNALVGSEWGGGPKPAEGPTPHPSQR